MSSGNRFRFAVGQAKAALLQPLRAGRDVTESAKIIGVSRSTVRLWRNADPQFDKDVIAARNEGVAKLMQERLALAGIITEAAE